MQIAGDDWEDNLKRTFWKYASEKHTLSVFEAKCALLELTGVEFSRVF